MPTLRLPYRPRGGARELFQCRDAEILVEGPAGTGKTRGVLELCNYFCVTFPGVRGLFLRQTRASLTESVLPTWETKVLWEGHPAISGKAGMENRRSYTYPRATNTVHGITYSGRSHIALAGLDKPSRTFSQEYDFVVLFEAIEVIDVGVWEFIQRCCRNWKMPAQIAIAETNPGPAAHWANQRANQALVREPGVAEVLGPPRPGQKQMTRIHSRHEDNPELWDDANARWWPKGAAYIAKLDSMTGPRHGRMRLGLWIDESGLIFELDPAVHYTTMWRASDSPLPDLKCHRRDPAGRLVFDWYFASVDWGMSAPGTIQVWGVDDVRSAMYLVAEVYFTQQTLRWWAERIGELDHEFQLRKVICDPSRNDLIELFNHVLTEAGHHTPEPLVIGGENDWEAGVQAIRLLSEKAADGLPRFFLVHDSLRHSPDPALADAFQPVCARMEFEGYVWRKNEMGKPIKEEAEPGLADHAIDPARYAAMWFTHASSPVPEDLDQVPPFEHGSAGDVLGHAAVWEKIRERG